MKACTCFSLVAEHQSTTKLTADLQIVGISDLTTPKFEGGTACAEVTADEMSEQWNHFSSVKKHQLKFITLLDAVKKNTFCFIISVDSNAQHQQNYEFSQHVMMQKDVDEFFPSNIEKLIFQMMFNNCFFFGKSNPTMPKFEAKNVEWLMKLWNNKVLFSCEQTLLSTKINDVTSLCASNPKNMWVELWFLTILTFCCFLAILI